MISVEGRPFEGLELEIVEGLNSPLSWTVRGDITPEEAALMWELCGKQVNVKIVDEQPARVRYGVALIVSVLPPGDPSSGGPWPAFSSAHVVLQGNGPLTVPWVPGDRPPFERLGEDARRRLREALARANAAEAKVAMLSAQRDVRGADGPVLRVEVTHRWAPDD